MTPSLWN